LLLVKKSFLLFFVLLFVLTGCSSRFEEPKVKKNLSSKNNSQKNSSSNKNNSQKSSSKSGVDTATMRPYKVKGHWYYPKKVDIGSYERGIASWYGKKFHGRKTSNGEIYNMHSLTAAHKTLPMNTMVYVKNIENDKTVTVRINDRGPFAGDRIIDLSKKAAETLNMLKDGTTLVELKILGYDGQEEISPEEETVSQAKQNSSEANDLNKTQAKNSSHINLEISKKDENKFETTTIKPITIIGFNETLNSLKEEEKQEKNIDITDSEQNMYPIGDENKIKNSEKEIAEERIKIVKKEQVPVIEYNPEVKKIPEITDDLKIDEQAKSKNKTSNEPVLSFYDDTELKISYYVQVSSFSKESGAKSFIKANKYKLNNSLSFKIGFENGLHKVWIQGFKDEAEARNYINSNDQFTSAWLVMKEE
jgi:rare lipoprotein A